MYKLLKLRHRYVFTKRNRLRLRYIFGCFAIVFAALTSLLGSSPSSVAFAPARVDVSQVSERSFVARDNIDDKLSPLLQVDDFPDEDFVVSVEEEFTQDAVEDLDRVLKIGSGDTVAGVLQKAGLNGAEVYRVVKAMGKHYDPRLVKPGQVLFVSMEQGGDGKSLVSLRMKLDSIREIVVAKDEHERFSADIQEKQVVLRQKVAQASIQNSLYGSAAKAGIPASVVADMIRIYSYEVDFQRDLRQGDTVELLYEIYETEDGDFARYGNILHANLMVRGQKIPVYRYKKADGAVDYFHENGKNLKRTLMQTPVDGARMSSGYGMRRHPVLGYNKMHKGVDFAAPRGTPIYAAGNGVIDKIGRNGGYGNYIRIKHNGTLKTAYAHLHRYAKGMKRGKRVKQGQVIGYVGSTGRSTGPHLHFEVISNGRQINPKKLKTAARETLAGAQLKRFQNHVHSVQGKYAALNAALKVAQSDVNR